MDPFMDQGDGLEEELREDQAMLSKAGWSKSGPRTPQKSRIAAPRSPRKPRSPRGPSSPSTPSKKRTHTLQEPSSPSSPAKKKTFTPQEKLAQREAANAVESYTRHQTEDWMKEFEGNSKYWKEWLKEQKTKFNRVEELKPMSTKPLLSDDSDDEVAQWNKKAANNTEVDVIRHVDVDPCNSMVIVENDKGFPVYVWWRLASEESASGSAVQQANQTQGLEGAESDHLGVRRRALNLMQPTPQPSKEDLEASRELERAWGPEKFNANALLGRLGGVDKGMQESDYHSLPLSRKEWVKPGGQAAPMEFHSADEQNKVCVEWYEINGRPEEKKDFHKENQKGVRKRALKCREIKAPDLDKEEGVKKFLVSDIILRRPETTPIPRGLLEKNRGKTFMELMDQTLSKDEELQKHMELAKKRADAYGPNNPAAFRPHALVNTRLPLEVSFLVDKVPFQAMNQIPRLTAIWRPNWSCAQLLIPTVLTLATFMVALICVQKICGGSRGSALRFPEPLMQT